MLDQVRAALERAPDRLRATGRPFVTLAYAQSVDGSIAIRRGERLRLSGEHSLRFTHQLRALHDALLVGVGTIIADNPQLTVRLAAGRSPQVVVLDSRLRVPVAATIFQRERGPWIATTEAADRRRAAEIEALGGQPLRIPATDAGWVDLAALLDMLGARGVRTVMVEGGSRVITSFLRSGLVDQVVVTITPTLVGGLRAVEALLCHNGSHPLRLADHSFAVCGDDVLLRGDVGSGTQ